MKSTKSYCVPQSSIGELALLRHSHQVSKQKRLEAALWALEQRMRYCLKYGNAVSVPPVGEFLKEGFRFYKDILGIPTKELARLWGIRASNLYKYLSGERNLQPALAIKIGATFGLDPELLLRIVLHHQLRTLTPSHQVAYSKQALLKRYTTEHG